MAIPYFCEQPGKRAADILALAKHSDPEVRKAYRQLTESLRRSVIAMAPRNYRCFRAGLILLGLAFATLLGHAVYNYHCGL